MRLQPCRGAMKAARRCFRPAKMVSNDDDGGGSKTGGDDAAFYAFQ